MPVVDAGTPAPIVVSQAGDLQAIVVGDEVAVVSSETNTPLPLGKSDLAILTL